MAIEIERKFLVVGDFKPYITASQRIVQGYLCTDPLRTVRVRIKGDQGFITIKGIGNASGVSRYEWEKEIAPDEANELLRLCQPGVISKVRHYIPIGERKFEVDEFDGENEGLTIAEIELGSEDEYFEHPTWLGGEVTGDKRYYNSYLSNHPFTKW